MQPSLKTTIDTPFWNSSFGNFVLVKPTYPDLHRVDGKGGKWGCEGWPIWKF
jgi:hypothetical protein